MLSKSYVEQSRVSQLLRCFCVSWDLLEAGVRKQLFDFLFAVYPREAWENAGV